jgi:S-DNA-T family DNA segregation ATPase FtsK/SpoIIIE
MATRRAGAETAARGRQGRHRRGSKPLFSQRVLRIGAGFSRAMPHLELTNRRNREFVGTLLLLAALLSGWALARGGEDGALPKWWGHALTVAYGDIGAWLVPLLLGMASIRFFRHIDGPVLVARHYIGGFFFAIAGVGLLQLSTAGPEIGPGGNSGMAVATIVQQVLGEVASAVLLLVVGSLGVFLLANTTIHGLVQDIRRVWPAKQPKPAATLGARSGRKVIASGNAQGEPRRPKGGDSPAPASAKRVINLPVRPEPVTPVAKDLPFRSESDPLPLPDIGTLAYYDSVTPDTVDLDAKARRIEETLTSFRVEAMVREVNPGPAVTQFALEPGIGVKVRRITELQNDLALALAAPSIRIEAPVPGMARVGLEIPNEKVATVGLRETLESSAFAKGEQKLPIPLGRDVHGRYVVGDLTRMPHLLIAGATGSGKSVCLNGIISTFLLSRQPDELKLLMIDPKMVELTGYNGVPHLQCPVVTEMDKVVGALRLVLREMERRYTLFSKLGVRNLDGYRMKTEDEGDAERLPYLVVVIDELADLMMTAPDEVESLLVRLAQMARATGIHLIIATQRPSVDVLTGLIKANVPARIAFAVSSGIDSRVVLDMPGAERLLGRGDMLFLPPDAAKPQRIQGAKIDDEDVQDIVAHWHRVTPVPHYAQEWLELPSSTSESNGDGEDDPLMEQALEIVQQQGTASASMLQRRLRVGYNRAARLIEQMEEDGIIGPADGIKGRPVLAAHE